MKSNFHIYAVLWAVLAILPVMFGRSVKVVWAQSPVVQEFEQQQQRLKSLKKVIKEKESNKSKLKNTAKSIIQRLADMDRKIKTLQQQIKDTKQQWTETDLAIVQCTNEVKLRQHDLNLVKSLYDEQLRALYEMGEVGTLNILLSSDSLTDFIERMNSLKLILANNKHLADNYQAALRKLMLSKEKLRLKSQQLAALNKKLQQEELDLEAQEQDKKTLLSDVMAQEKQYDIMLSELKKAESSLKGIIGRLRQGLTRLQIVEKEGPNCFAAQKGKLFPPALGPIERPPASTGAKGIIILARWGAEIRAIFDGRVVYRDILPGYGRVMIVDHGNHYYTLIAQAAKFFKNVGDHVAQGDILGIVGSGPWAQHGIYFEIRHGDQMLNPLLWLDPSSIKLVTSSQDTSVRSGK